MRKLQITIPVLMALAALLSGCETSPATGKKHINFLSESSERNFGQQLAPQFLDQYGGKLPAPPVAAYVRDLGRRLAAVSERRDLEWEFYVPNSAQINAFALPGGKVFVTRGLLEKLSSEAQLAGVLGHEIGHVTDQHAGRQMARASLVQLGVGGAAAVAGEYGQWVSVIGGFGGKGFVLKFSRKQEYMADQLGVRYMAKLGYNPMAQIEVMKVLKQASEGRSAPEFFSTHPHPDSRIERLQSHILHAYPDHADTGKYTQGEASFRQNVLSALRDVPPADKKDGD